MALLAPDPGSDEEDVEAGRGLDLDLELRACPACRRELLPWQEVCPEDGAEPVPRTQLPPDDGPPVPDHLREDGSDGGSGADRDEPGRA